MFNISDTDIKRSTQVAPGWQTVKIDDVVEDRAKTDGSKLLVVDMIILGGDYDGVPLRTQFSEKAPGFAIPFFKACGAPVGEKGTPLEKGGALDEKKCIGKTIRVFVKNDLYDGRMTNKVSDYAKVEEGVTA